MTSPEAIRERLSNCDFFTQLSAGWSDDQINLISASSNALFGINQSDETIISVGLTGRQNIQTITTAPLHCVDNIIQSEAGKISL